MRNVVVVDESLLYLIYCNNTCIGRVYGPKSFSHCFEINIGQIVNQKLKGFELDLLGCPEVSQLLYDALFYRIRRVKLLYFKPGIFQTLLRCYPSFGIFIKHPRNKLFGLRAYIFPVDGIKLQFLMKHILKYLFVIVSFKRWIATEENEQNYAQAPYVTRVGVGTFEYFWCHIIWSSNDGLQFDLLKALVTSKSFGKAKINKLDFRFWSVICKEEIFWFQISVADLMFVQVFDCREDFLHQLSCSPFTKPFALYDFIEELATLGKFHYDMNIPIVDVAFMKFDDVRVVNLPKNL